VRVARVEGATAYVGLDSDFSQEGRS